MDPILDTLTVEQALQQYREDYAQMSREFQAYREVKEEEIQNLKDELDRATSLVDSLVSQQRQNFLDRM